MKGILKNTAVGTAVAATLALRPSPWLPRLTHEASAAVASRRWVRRPRVWWRSIWWRLWPWLPGIWRLRLRLWPWLRLRSGRFWRWTGSNWLLCLWLLWALRLSWLRVRLRISRIRLWLRLLIKRAPLGALFHMLPAVLHPCLLDAPRMGMRYTQCFQPTTTSFSR